jgi:fructose-1,6-bisphosphatase I
MATAQSKAINVDLGIYLRRNAAAEIADAVTAIAHAAIQLSHHIRRGPLDGDLGIEVGASNPDGDPQKALDIYSDRQFSEGLRGCGVRAMVSEEREHPVMLDEQGRLLVAIDPLDGSSNIDANISIGTIFSLLDASPYGRIGARDFLQPGRRQRAAGFVLYGPQTCFVFTTGDGVDAATLDPDDNCFKMSRLRLRIPEGSAEFAINASNYRHWRAPVRAYFDDCIEGEEGPRSKNFNMRWIASIVADIYRILVRGGVYLYPADERPGHSKGRLHILYEASPAALLIEQAGGAAIDGLEPILDIVPHDIHARTPLIFGSADKVARVRRYFAESEHPADRSPLFGRRGLLRR